MGVRTGLAVAKTLAPQLHAHIEPSVKQQPSSKSSSPSLPTPAAGRSPQRLPTSPPKPNRSYLFSALAPTVKRMHVCVPDPRSMPQLGPALALQEQTAMLGGRFSRAAEGVGYKQRRKYFRSKAALAKHWYEPELCYTFDFYSAGPDFTTFKLGVAGKQLPLAGVLAAQPLRFLARVLPQAMPDYVDGCSLSLERLVAEFHDRRRSSSSGGGGGGEHDPLGVTTRELLLEARKYDLWNLEVWHECQLES
jgi:hypothetical protein